MPEPPSDPASKGIRAVAMGTCHDFQRHQDKMPESEEVRTQFEKRLHQIFTGEAGDDEETWGKLKHVG